MPRFAANLTMLFGEVPFPARFAAAAAAGFRAVEFLFPYDNPPGDIAGWLRDAGLECALFNLPPGDWAAGERGIAALPGREDEFRRSVETALGYARALGVRRVHAMAGLTDGADRATYVANLRRAAVALAAEGLELLIEPISPTGIPGYFLNEWAEARAIAAEVAAPNLRLQADLFHLAMLGEDVCGLLRRDSALIGHIQVAGVPERHEPDRADLDCARIFSLLDEIGYQGWVGCEYRPLGRTEDGLGWVMRLTGPHAACP